MQRSDPKGRTLSAGGNRRAVSLIEMIMMLVLLVVIMGLSAKMFRGVMGNTVRMHRDFEVYTSVQDMLRDLRKDVEGSKNLVRYAGDDSAGGDLLRIDSPGGAISYGSNEDAVFRTVGVSDPNEGGEKVWVVPHAQIEWQVLERGGKGHALEIKTWIERTVYGEVERKLYNSHVYFVGIIRGDEN